MDWIILISTIIISFIFLLILLTHSKVSLIDKLFAHILFVLNFMLAYFISINLWNWVIDCVKEAAGI